MKILKTLLLSLVMVALMPSIAFARDVVKQSNGETCVDLEAMYAEVNDESKALTGMDNSVDAIKKAQTVGTLTNIISALVGNQIYCIKDEVSAARTSSLKDNGFLGQIAMANSQMFGYFPSVNVADHLAQEFLPGYDGNTFLFAQEENDPTNTGDEPAAGSDFNFQDKIQGPLEEALNDSVEEQVDNAQGMADEIDGTDNEGQEITISGYKYLQDNLHLDAVWKIFRNIAYVFFVVIMIITGFMIMFRKNLPGQVVASLGNTLPQVILGIILVTFSFSIAGIVMDAGKATMNVIDGIFVQAYQEVDGNGIDIGGDAETIVEDTATVDNVGKLTNQAIQSAKREGLIMRLIRKIPLGIGDSIADFMTSLGSSIGGIALQSYLLYDITEKIDTLAHEDTNIDPGFGVDLIVDPIVEVAEAGFDLFVLKTAKVAIIPLLLRNILFLLVCLYASFKLFITMITTYLKLFISIIFAPIQIAIGSLPGNFSMIGKWFKSLLSGVLVFVGIHLVIHLFTYLSKVIDPTQFNFFGNKGVFWPNWIISLEGVILIGGYLFASSMPTIINGMLKVETSKELASVGQSVKQAASKIPLVGGMFGA